MAKRKTGTATIEREGPVSLGKTFSHPEDRQALESMLQDQVDDDIQDEQTETMPAKIEPPVASLADLIERMALVSPEELAEAIEHGGYQFRDGRASIEVKLNDTESDALRKMLLVLMRSNTRLGGSPFAPHVKTKADGARWFFGQLAEEVAGANPAPESP